MYNIISTEISERFKGTKWEATFVGLSSLINALPSCLKERTKYATSKDFLVNYIGFLGTIGVQTEPYIKNVASTYISVNYGTLATGEVGLRKVTDIRTSTICSNWSGDKGKDISDYFNMLIPKITDETIRSFVYLEGTDDFAAFCILSRLLNVSARNRLMRKICPV